MAKDPSTFSDSDFVVNTRYFNANSATQIAYEASTGVLSLKKRDGTVIGSTNLPLDSIVNGVVYDDTNETLVITFTNGQTTVIPLQSLLLPAWVNDLYNIPNGSGNVPPTADSVKSYVDNSAADAIRAVVTSAAVLVDDLSSLNPQILITPSSSGTVYVYGRNLINSAGVTAYSNNTYPGAAVGNADGSVVWSAGANYISFDTIIPKGTTVSYSYDWSSEGSESIGRISFYGESISGTPYHTFNAGNTVKNGTFVASDNIYKIAIFKTNPSTPLAASITLTNLSLNVGGNSWFEPFEAPDVYNNVSTFSIDPTTAKTILAVTPTAPLTVSYTRDSTKVINNLIKKIEELQNALAT